MRDKELHESDQEVQRKQSQIHQRTIKDIRVIVF